MNKKRFAIFLVGLAVAIAALIARPSAWPAIALLWVAFDSMLAPRMAACFANNFGTLNSALILQQALTLLFTKRPVLNMFSTSLTDENGVMAKYNQQVLVRTKSVATVGNFGDAATDAATPDVPVTLDQWKQIYLKFTPQQYESTNRDLIAEQAEPIAVGIGNYIIDYVAAKFTQANFGARKTVKGAGWDYNHLTSVRSTLNQRGVPDLKRFYIASSPVYQSLLDDPMVVAFFNNQVNAEAIKTGKLPVVAGFGIDEYPNLTTATGDNTVVAISGTPGSVAVASRAPQLPKNFSAQFPGNVGYITDPKSGFTIRVTEWIDPTTMNANVRVDWIFGAALGQLDEGQLITNA